MPPGGDCLVKSGMENRACIRLSAMIQHNLQLLRCQSALHKGNPVHKHSFFMALGNAIQYGLDEVDISFMTMSLAVSDNVSIMSYEQCSRRSSCSLITLQGAIAKERNYC